MTLYSCVICVRSPDNMLFGTSEASQKLGATKAKLGFFDFEVVRVQILKEGLEATRNHLREKEMRESSAHGQGMIQRARRDSSKYNDIKCEVCAKQTTTRLTSMQCAGCLLLRQAKKREDEEARHHQQLLL